MSSAPEEKASWEAVIDAEATARELREQLNAAKARMREHRDQMHAAGLTTHPEDPDSPAT